MDPNTATRAEFTAHLTSKPIPTSAAPAWKKLVITLRVLLDKLAAQPAMAANLQQTYMTPANSKNKVYFMWDFVGRTLGYVYMVDPSLEGLGRQEKEKWDEAKGRAVYSSQLIRDEMKGMLNMMTEQTYPGAEGEAS